MPIFARFDLAPERALAFFGAKGLKTSFAWQDMLHAEHDASFTVAKLMQTDLLGDVKAAVDRAISEGQSFGQFRAGLEPELVRRGWWGRAEVTDPLTGKKRRVQLGSPRRLRTIYRTNLRTAYAAGRWSSIVENAGEAPFLLYDAVDDGRTRPEHRAWDGKVLRFDDPWFRTHYPPNGWNCRCTVIQLSQRQLERLGKKGPDPAPDSPTREWLNPRTGELVPVPVGIDPGWAYHPGRSRLAEVQRLAREKLGQARAGELLGALPGRALNRLRAAFRSSTLLRDAGRLKLDEDLLGDVGALKAVEHYAAEVRPGILDEIGLGGTAGSAVLVHELAEVRALRRAGLDVFDPDDVAEIKRRFGLAIASGDPARHTPWHIEALRVELEYAQRKLAERGVNADLSEVARALYPRIVTRSGPWEKMVDDLAAIGLQWPEAPARQDLLDALSL